jgi:hypothetical protein
MLNLCNLSWQHLPGDFFSIKDKLETIKKNNNVIFMVRHFIEKIYNLAYSFSDNLA